MFNEPTILVLGAGASCEAGLPSGEGLKEKIVARLQFTSDGRYLSDRQINGAMSDFMRARRDQGNPTSHNDILRAAQEIARGMPYARSIDNYLDAHADDALIRGIGKIVIAASILSAEDGSLLKFYRGNDFSPGELANTWFPAFAQMITANVRRESVGDIFKNLTIISFNYDRCIERYLMQAIRQYYRLTDEEAIASISRLRVLHPYGQVGYLPWQNGNPEAEFGGKELQDILPVAENLKTYTETVESSLAGEIRQAVGRAHIAIFLGFAFHRQNIELLSAHGGCNISRVFTTTLGISPFDRPALIRDLSRIVGQQVQSHLDASTCRNLFDMYAKTLGDS